MQEALQHNHIAPFHGPCVRLPKRRQTRFDSEQIHILFYCKVQIRIHSARSADQRR